MVAFATAEDLATHLQRDLSAEETATATQELEIASGIIRTYTGQPITEVAADTENIVPLRGNSGVIILKHAPVTTVDSVTEDGTLLVVDDDYAWSEAGILWRVGVAAWVNPVVVVYTHGYATTPDDIKGVTLDLAGERFNGGGEVRSESIGMYQVTYAGATRELSPMHQLILRSYRI